MVTVLKNAPSKRWKVIALFYAWQLEEADFLLAYWTGNISGVIHRLQYYTK